MVYYWHTFSVLFATFLRNQLAWYVGYLLPSVLPVPQGKKLPGDNSKGGGGGVMTDILDKKSIHI